MRHGQLVFPGGALYSPGGAGWLRGAVQCAVTPVVALALVLLPVVFVAGTQPKNQSQTYII
jgi:hypothetical protein